MLDVRLPDGTWVTTPLAVGTLTPRCAGDCRWEDEGPVDADGPVRIQLQRCLVCGWIRGRYLDDPHPDDNTEDNDDRADE